MTDSVNVVEGCAEAIADVQKFVEKMIKDPSSAAEGDPALVFELTDERRDRSSKLLDRIPFLIGTDQPDLLAREIVEDAEEDAEMVPGRHRYGVRMKGRPNRLVFGLNTVNDEDELDDLDELELEIDGSSQVFGKFMDFFIMREKNAQRSADANAARTDSLIESLRAMGPQFIALWESYTKRRDEVMPPPVMLGSEAIDPVVLTALSAFLVETSHDQIQRLSDTKVLTDAQIQSLQFLLSFGDFRKRANDMTLAAHAAHKAAVDAADAAYKAAQDAVITPPPANGSGTQLHPS